MSERRSRVRVAFDTQEVPTCRVTDGCSTPCAAFIEDISLGGVSMRLGTDAARFDIGDGVRIEIDRVHGTRMLEGQVVWISMDGEPLALGVKWTDVEDAAFLQSYLDELLSHKAALSSAKRMKT